METRYHALRIISILDRAIAVVVLIGSVLQLFGVLQLPSLIPATQLGGLAVTAATTASIWTLLYGVLVAIALWAKAELIMLFIHCEEHLRGMHDMMFYRQQNPQPPAPARRNLWED